MVREAAVKSGDVPGSSPGWTTSRNLIEEELVFIYLVVKIKNSRKCVNDRNTNGQVLTKADIGERIKPIEALKRNTS